MRDTPDAVMLFAAGFGTRMKPLTDSLPKPMIKVAGKPLIDHALDLVSAISPRVTVANLHYLPQPLVDHLEPKGVALSLESPDILDTGGGLRQALPMLGDGPVLTVNTDAVWAGPNPLVALRAAWDPDKMDALLTCIPLERTVGRSGGGDFRIDQSGRLTRGGEMVYGGVQIIRTERLLNVPDKAFSLNRVWNDMHQEGRLFGLSYPGTWCDVGHPGGIALAENMLSRHV
ncbi:nucleotidyltransferase family protein [Primorskyibacter sp. S87]|uniref:nucleotidyltransferase family protein n=1 Tax=Primorskyibacter sp. S87 TaxID=3415126 RepID=UPI003C7989D2